MERTDDRWFPMGNSMFRIQRQKRLSKQEDEEEKGFDQ